MNPDWSLVAVVVAVVGCTVADTLITRRGGRYAAAVYSYITSTAALIAVLTFWALTVLDSKLDLPWWGDEPSWFVVAWVGILFPMILIYSGRDWPRKRAAYLLERKIRRGELVRWNRPDLLTGEPGGDEAVAHPDVAARMQERDRTDQERRAARKEQQVEMDRRREASLVRLEELEAKLRKN